MSGPLAAVEEGGSSDANSDRARERFAWRLLWMWRSPDNANTWRTLDGFSPIVQSGDVLGHITDRHMTMPSGVHTGICSISQGSVHPVCGVCSAYRTARIRAGRRLRGLWGRGTKRRTASWAAASAVESRPRPSTRSPSATTGSRASGALVRRRRRRWGHGSSALPAIAPQTPAQGQRGVCTRGAGD